MKTFMAFPICSLVFILLVSVVYFYKPRIKSIENSIYKWLVVSNIIGLILEILCYFAVDLVTEHYFISIVILKLYVVYIFVWSVIFNVYVFVVSHKNYDKKDNSLNIYFNKVKRITILASIIISIIMLMLPIEIFNDGKLTYTYGPITNVLILLCFIIVGLWIIKCIKHFRDLKQKRYIPIIACIIILTLVLIIQSYDRSILIATTGHTFIVILMYFTIENPDVKMINELNKNRLLINQITEEKSNFLFLASSQLKSPINNILEISDSITSEKDEKVIKEDIKQINNLAHSLTFLVENVMDISSLTINNIKIVNNKYNLSNLITKIKLLKEKEVNNEVEFRVNISETIPSVLYGDSKLLELAIISIIDNSIKYTKTGFIELNVNTIIKYDMCRLLISIEDSGCGISIDKVNELLMLDEDLNKEEIESLETKNVNINTIKKIVSKMGGYFTIKSEIDKGTEVKIVIDQKIELKNNLVDASKYLKKETVLLVSDDNSFLKDVSKLINQKGYNVEVSAYSNDILDRIRLKQTFSYILIDDNIKNRALPILKELKKDAKFKTPVIVILDKNTEFIKKHFLEDGFSDYLLKSNLVKEIDRVLK